MPGLPCADNMRCRLFEGLSVSRASSSNPPVALTRSRKMIRATSGSPLRKSVAASSSIAFANEGSRSTRSITVCLKSRVNAIALSFLPARRRGLPGLVLREQLPCILYVGLLAALGAATQKDDQRIPVLGQINPVARSPVDDVFAHPAELLDPRRVADAQPQLGRCDLCRRLRIQRIKP